MRLKDLKRRLTIPIFFDYQIEKIFSDEPRSQINVQLSRMVKRGDLIRLKRGIFVFTDTQLDEMILANMLYSPSYVSLESALHVSGVIPDIAMNVTSISLTNSKKIVTKKGVFLYSKINKDLYFGFKKVKSAVSELYYNIAFPEKALLDYIYIRKINNLEGQRVDIKELNKQRLKEYSKHFPLWVRRVIYE